MYEAIARGHQRVCKENLGDFMAKESAHLTEEELIAIIRRIDLDGDAMFDVREFALFLEGFGQSNGMSTSQKEWKSGEYREAMRFSKPLISESLGREGSPKRDDPYYIYRPYEPMLAS